MTCSWCWAVVLDFFGKAIFSPKMIESQNSYNMHQGSRWQSLFIHYLLIIFFLNKGPLKYLNCKTLIICIRHLVGAKASVKVSSKSMWNIGGVAHRRNCLYTLEAGIPKSNDRRFLPKYMDKKQIIYLNHANKTIHGYQAKSLVNISYPWLI